MLSTSIYILMSWLVIFAFEPLLIALSTNGVTLLIFGGVLYTIGGILYAIKLIGKFLNILDITKFFIFVFYSVVYLTSYVSIFMFCNEGYISSISFNFIYTNKKAESLRTQLLKLKTD